MSVPIQPVQRSGCMGTGIARTGKGGGGCDGCWLRVYDVSPTLHSFLQKVNNLSENALLKKYLIIKTHVFPF